MKTLEIKIAYIYLNNIMCIRFHFNLLQANISKNTRKNIQIKVVEYQEG